MVEPSQISLSNIKQLQAWSLFRHLKAHTFCATLVLFLLMFSCNFDQLRQNFLRLVIICICWDTPSEGQAFDEFQQFISCLLWEPLYTFGKQYCSSPTLRVSQLIYEITNLWKFTLNRSLESGETLVSSHFAVSWHVFKINP